MKTTEAWRHCGTCKKEIAYDTHYFSCSVSGCNKSVYCSLDCFSDHVPVMRHKDAWAEERRSPRVAEASNQERTVHYVARSSQASLGEELPHDILIVASKLKDYIRVKSGMNTSANVMDRLSDIVRQYCDKAIAHAAQDGRKTVMDRDF